MDVTKAPKTQRSDCFGQKKRGVAKLMGPEMPWGLGLGWKTNMSHGDFGDLVSCGGRCFLGYTLGYYTCTSSGSNFVHWVQNFLGFSDGFFIILFSVWLKMIQHISNNPCGDVKNKGTLWIHWNHDWPREWIGVFPKHVQTNPHSFEVGHLVMFFVLKNFKDPLCN